MFYLKFAWSIIEKSEIFPVDQLGFALNVIKKLDIVIFTQVNKMNSTNYH